MQWWHIWEDDGPRWKFAFWFYGNVYQATDYATFLTKWRPMAGGQVRYAISSYTQPGRLLGPGW